jgi:glycerophosphoryl diester phosphodiesterase
MPENTLPAFARGLEQGADRLELDVHATADGHVVVVHDETLERTTNGTGAVRGVSLEELQSLDAGWGFTAADGTQPFRGRGFRVPTLAEVCAAFPEVPLNVEIKQLEPPIETAVLSVLDRFAARARTLLAAEQGEIMARIRTQAAGVLTSFSAPEVADFVSRLRGGTLAGCRPAGVALQVPPAFRDVPIITPALVAAAHDLGLEVHAWTINERAEMERLLALGVDGLMTDFPALGREVVERFRSA